MSNSKEIERLSKAIVSGIGRKSMQIALTVVFDLPKDFFIKHKTPEVINTE